jgi:hypothetical protein
MTSSTGQRLSLALALLAVLGMPAAAAVAPGPASAAPAPGNEGGTPMLRDVLETTGRGFVEAKNAVANSRKRQQKLSFELQQVERRIAELSPEVGTVAANAYQTGRVGPVLVLLNSASPDDFLARAEGLDQLAMHDDGKLRALYEARTQATRAKAAIDAEVAEEQKQFLVMTKRKQEAERALQLVGGKTTDGFVSATSPVASQAPRNGDGSWPPQSCDQSDPTTSGCITPRMMHALLETRRVGFTRFVSCFRPGGPYEHPKGRACDFSVKPSGFGGDAAGGDKIYGNNLAAFLVRNADKLGILYVIWYRQIWFPVTGWNSYGGGQGDPSSEHTNHVHLSVL